MWYEESKGMHVFAKGYWAKQQEAHARHSWISVVELCTSCGDGHCMKWYGLYWIILVEGKTQRDPVFLHPISGFPVKSFLSLLQTLQLAIWLWNGSIIVTPITLFNHMSQLQKPVGQKETSVHFWDARVKHQVLFGNFLCGAFANPILDNSAKLWSQWHVWPLVDILPLYTLSIIGTAWA